MTTEFKMLPYKVVVKATEGDPEAINQVLEHYQGFIINRSLRPIVDEFGRQRMVIDETLYGRMQSRLLKKILSFKIK